MYARKQPLLLCVLCGCPISGQPWPGGLSRVLMGGTAHSTYICRVQSSVWRLPKYEPPPPLHPASVFSPRIKGGWGVVNILEDARHWIGLSQYSIIPLRGTAWSMFHRYCDIFATRSLQKCARSVLIVHRYRNSTQRFTRKKIRLCSLVFSLFFSYIWIRLRINPVNQY